MASWWTPVTFVAKSLKHGTKFFALGTLRETTPFPQKTARQKSTGCSRNLAVEIKEW
jgi:hypothetical protein